MKAQIVNQFPKQIVKTQPAKASIPSFKVLAVGTLLAALSLPAHAQYGNQPQYGPQNGPNDASQPGPQAGDPPDRVARLSYVGGNVSFQPNGVEDFSQAEANFPLTTGDRLYTDPSGIAEIETTALALRVGRATDLTVTGLNDQAAQFGITQGSIRVRTYGLPGNSIVEIDTPNGTITVVQPGDIRVDTYPQSDTTVVSVNSGEVQLSGPELNQIAGGGQAIELRSGPRGFSARSVGMPRPDDLDRFDQDRDAQRVNAALLIRDQYVNQDMIGYDDLSAYGDWTPSPDYGQVWYPRAVAAGWIPYQNGHWAWIAPWGWTWVEAEPWGFAPFHYGRWAQFGGRWGWVPGPPAVRPVYSPALVAFVGGPNFSISVGFGGGSGAGVTAWFPLGPREPYVPWYHASPGYVNRINVSNLYNRNVTEVRNTYNNRTTNIYVNNTTVNNVYVNRNVATTAVAQRDFAAGRPVQRTAIHVDPAQLSRAEVLPHPLVTPTREIVAPAPTRVLPPTVARPVMQSGGNPPRVIQTQPVAPTQAPPMQATPGVRSEPFSPPATQPAQVKRPEIPNQTPIPAPAPAPTQSVTAPTVRNQPPVQAPVAQAQPVVQPRPASQPRPLINRVDPPPAQPRFDVQQREIEHNDPGRPLGPVQTENLRQGKPAGPPSQPENHPHPQPPPR